MKLRNKLILVATITGLSVGANAAVIVPETKNDTGFTVSSTDLLGLNVTSTTNNLTINVGENNGSVGTVGNLTDGLFQTTPADKSNSYAISGGDITYELDTTVNTLGYDLSSIDIYTGWNDGGRSQITNVTVSYATVAAPLTFINIATANNTGGNKFQSAVITETTSPNLLATGVKSVKFTFGAQQNNGVGYKELDVVGVATIPEPSSMVLLGLAGIGLISRRRRTA